MTLVAQGLIEENTWSILCIVTQHLDYAKSVIFFTVSHVKNYKVSERIWQYSPKCLKIIPFLQGMRTMNKYVEG